MVVLRSPSGEHLGPGETGNQHLTRELENQHA
jgi:hypothetical protein